MYWMSYLQVMTDTESITLGGCIHRLIMRQRYFGHRHLKVTRCTHCLCYFVSISATFYSSTFFIQAGKKERLSNSCPKLPNVANPHRHLQKIYKTIQQILNCNTTDTRQMFQGLENLIYLTRNSDQEISGSGRFSVENKLVTIFWWINHRIVTLFGNTSLPFLYHSLIYQLINSIHLY